MLSSLLLFKAYINFIIMTGSISKQTQCEGEAKQPITVLMIKCDHCVRLLLTDD